VKKKKRIKKKSSMTANWTCMCRAFSYMEKHPAMKTNDFIAPQLLPVTMRPFLRIKFLRSLMLKLARGGLYGYLIARTKYLDSIVESAVKDHFEQILIMGAGFDSRGIRLLKEESNITLFELDAPTTQQSKRKQYKKRKIDSPSYIRYIPIDFNEESLENKLAESEFDSSKKTLFVLEGLTMYLDSESISETFSIIRQNSGHGSRLVFDYVYDSVIAQKDKLYGGEEAYNTVKNAGEEWTFGIKKEELDLFLAQFDFTLMEEMNPVKLQERYFQGLDLKINEAHSIVLAQL